NSGATITWHANENGSFTVRRGGTNCTTDPGTQVATGTYSSSPGSVNTPIAATDLNAGSNTLRVCVTDVSSNVGASENVTVTKDITPPTSSVTFPANGASLTSANYTAGCTALIDDACGSASDAGGAGLQKVEVAIQRA